MMTSLFKVGLRGTVPLMGLVALTALPDAADAAMLACQQQCTPVPLNSSYLPGPGNYAGCLCINYDPFSTPVFVPPWQSSFLECFQLSLTQLCQKVATQPLPPPVPVGNGEGGIASSEE